MASGPRSLREVHPRRIDIPLLAVVAMVGLVVTIQLPALEFEGLFGDHAFSILTGIRGFVESGNLLLALLLFAFSVAFPLVKLGAILVLWFRRLDPALRGRWMWWLELLGKWSLLDSFVIAVLIGTVQFGVLRQATARPGVYLYLAAILLSLVATFLMRPLSGVEREPRTGRLGQAGLWITIPSAVLYGIGLSTPLMDVEKALFWQNRYSVLQGTARMFSEGELVLAGAIALFVIALPTLRFLGLIALRLLHAPDSRLVRWLRLLDKWSMADVFVLALLVVFSRLGGIAQVTPRIGLGLLFCSAVLTGADSVLLHLRRRR